MKEQHQYREPECTSVAQVRSLVTQEKLEEASVAIIGLALYSMEFESIYELIIELSKNHNPYLRGNAILCIGHLSFRLVRGPSMRFFEKKRVCDIVAKGLADSEKYVREQSYDAASDIQHYLGWTVEGFKND